MSVLSLSSSLSLPTQRLRLQPLVPAGTAAQTRHVSSQFLLDGARELIIQHQGSEYHLRLTRNDKLILTK
ncbi:hemin uptake protein HemP [Rhodanobacter sp. Col0626]|uniref:hemin uptake protein HemP n=1 Tax=Rhodanobacter sp. Col0626 TaxID=3415679 RepID=UPI003CE6EF00